MADIVMAYSASHAPMMSADKESAPPDQAERFFGGLAKVRQQAAESRPQAIVFMTGGRSSRVIPGWPSTCSRGW